MRNHILIFNTITVMLILVIIGLQDSVLLPYVEVMYVIITFAESYFVLQNYDFEKGVPFYTAFFKLINTIIILVSPLAALVIHIVTNAYIYSHIKSLKRRDKRLKFDYTVNNVIPGPLLLKVVASFLSPLLFIVLTALASFRIREKLLSVERIDILKYIVLADVLVLVMLFTRLSIVSFLIYVIMLIIFEFIPIEKRLR